MPKKLIISQLKQDKKLEKENDWQSSQNKRGGKEGKYLFNNEIENNYQVSTFQVMP